jgi:hypothetical protein
LIRLTRGPKTRREFLNLLAWSGLAADTKYAYRAVFGRAWTVSI